MRIALWIRLVFSEAAYWQKKHQILYETLYKVLQQNEEATLTDLVVTYGLGDDAVAPFALDLVSRAGLSEACPLLRRLEKAIARRPIDSYKAPRQELQAAIVSLQCK